MSDQTGTRTGGEPDLRIVMLPAGVRAVAVVRDADRRAELADALGDVPGLIVVDNLLDATAALGATAQLMAVIVDGQPAANPMGTPAEMQEVGDFYNAFCMRTDGPLVIITEDQSAAHSLWQVMTFMYPGVVSYVAWEAVASVRSLLPPALFGADTG